QKQGVFARLEHPRQVIHGGVGVGVAHALDEGADQVVVLLACFVVEQGLLLGGLLGGSQRDRLLGLRQMSGDFVRIEQASGVAGGVADQKVGRLGGEREAKGVLAALQ